VARDRTVFTVGQEMADAYQAVTDHVHIHFPCLVGEAQMAELSASRPQPEPNRLLCVGRLSAEKGYPYLLEALAQLKSQGIICFLDFVGSGPLEETLKAQTAALGLTDTVTFKGYVPYGPDLFALYQRAMALVVPSLSEGFPQVIAEALCAGLPTIASAVGGIPGLLTHLETAILVPPADVSALVEAVKLVLETPEVRERLRTNGRALMHVNTLEAQRDRMVRVIQDEILSKQQPAYRSALADYPDGLPPAQPTVVAVVPVYNEISHIKSVVDGLLTQDY
jgi:glycosyltransferase involved in cell wall biosynthesis